MKSFLSAILPSQGVYFVAAKAGTGFAHYPCHSIEDMVSKAQEIDAEGLDAYFACASYKQDSYVDANGKRRQRTAENAEWANSFWLDIDCGPEKAEAEKGYATINEALAALQKLRGCPR